MTKVEAQKALRNKRREKGLCIACGKPCAPFKQCERHRKLDANRVLNKKKRYVDSGRCKECGVIVDGGFNRCVNCQDDIWKRKSLMRSL